jgi:hypothetical protein
MSRSDESLDMGALLNYLASAIVRVELVSLVSITKGYHPECWTSRGLRQIADDLKHVYLDLMDGDRDILVEEVVRVAPLVGGSLDT